MFICIIIISTVVVVVVVVVVVIIIVIIVIVVVAVTVVIATSLARTPSSIIRASHLSALSASPALTHSNNNNHNCCNIAIAPRPPGCYIQYYHVFVLISIYIYIYIYIAGLHAGVHDDVVADGVGLYAVAAHPHEPLLREEMSRARLIVARMSVIVAILMAIKNNNNNNNSNHNKNHKNISNDSNNTTIIIIIAIIALLRAPDVAPLGAGVDHGVVADRVRPG